jgi:hypothetical protein
VVVAFKSETAITKTDVAISETVASACDPSLPHGSLRRLSKAEGPLHFHSITIFTHQLITDGPLHFQ